MHKLNNSLRLFSFTLFLIEKSPEGEYIACLYVCASLIGPKTMQIKRAEISLRSYYWLTFRLCRRVRMDP